MDFERGDEDVLARRQGERGVDVVAGAGFEGREGF